MGLVPAEIRTNPSQKKVATHLHRTSALGITRYARSVLPKEPTAGLASLRRGPRASGQGVGHKYTVGGDGVAAQDAKAVPPASPCQALNTRVSGRPNPFVSASPLCSLRE